MKNAIGTQSYIKHPEKEQTGLNTGKQLKWLNEHFLTTEFKKSY